MITNNFMLENGDFVETVNTEVKTEVITVHSKEAFIKHYVDFYSMLDQLDKASVKVITWAILNCGYNNNIVALNKPMCDIISTEKELTYGSVKNAISKLKQKGILMPIGSGMYRINPRYAWKGDNGERVKAMKFNLTIQY